MRHSPSQLTRSVGFQGFVRPPKRESIRRLDGILDEIASGILDRRTRPLIDHAHRFMLSRMGYEVEQKFRLTDHDALARRLIELGACRGPEIHQEDIYLNHPARDFAATGEALRIRRVGADNRVTYKGPRLSGPTKTREEIELAVTSGDPAFHQLAQLFDHLGFRPVATIRKSRTPFHLHREGHDIEVVLDTAIALGHFAEIETLAETAADLPAAQRVIQALAQELGLTEVEPRSYLRMLLESR